MLVIDEVGYLSYGPYAANVLFPVVDKRYLKGDRPMLLTTNKDPREWGVVLHDPDLSAAILDRLLHRGEILRLTGRSYRQHRPGQPPREEPPVAPPPGKRHGKRGDGKNRGGNRHGRIGDDCGGPLMPREREYRMRRRGRRPIGPGIGPRRRRCRAIWRRWPAPCTWDAAAVAAGRSPLPRNWWPAAPTTRCGT